MIPIKNAAEFTRLLVALSEDVIDANIHYRLYCDLLDARDKYPRVIAQSPAFWGITLKSHLNSCLHLLTRVFDQDQRALHLKSWLITIKENISFFDEINFRERLKNNPFIDSLAQDPRRPDDQQLDSDIASCSDSDELVKRLIIHRGNSIAHRNAKNAATGKHVSDNHPLSFEDLEELLNRAITILNRYSDLFEASTYSTQMIGHDDYKRIFKYVDEGVAELRRKHQAPELDK
ncbi:MAG: hypothetical protein HY272_02335 [Gammaproteobacteria bacterium]|nr:hypothetical protein [Gammaproteobacteria bacterium]